MLLWPFQLHLGEPAHPTETRSAVAVHRDKTGARTSWVIHPVSRWWGVYYKSLWFLGFTTYQPQKTQWTEGEHDHR